MSLLEDFLIICPDSVSGLEIKSVQPQAALVVFLCTSPCEASPCTGSITGRAAPRLAIPRWTFPCASRANEGRARVMLGKKLLGRYRGVALPEVSEEVQGTRHPAWSALQPNSSSSHECPSHKLQLWSYMPKSLPISALHSVKVHACYRLKCIRPVDLF